MDELTSLIGWVKRESFPELRGVRVKGGYIPLTELLQDDSFARVKPTTLGLTINDTEIHIGFATIQLPDFLSSAFPLAQQHPNLVQAVKEGLIAHELSHVVCRTVNEATVIDETIRRGYGKQVALCSWEVEEWNLIRPSYLFSAARLLEKMQLSELEFNSFGARNPHALA